MKIDRIAAEIDAIAPLKLAQSWDNVGFLIGDRDREIRRILVTIDITRDVVAEAKSVEADLIVSYHPVIWDGLKKITADGPAGVVYELIHAGIGVYSIHTSLDVVAGGVNDALADVLGLVDCTPIGDYVDDPAGPLYKLITFVPVADVDKVAEAVHAAGAGQIGNYAKCSFRVQGTGTFVPLEGAKPAIGREGKLETVRRCGSNRSCRRIGAAVIAAMRRPSVRNEPRLTSCGTGTSRRCSVWGGWAGSGSHKPSKSCCRTLKRSRGPGRWVSLAIQGASPEPRPFARGPAAA